jgi:hypothetical protein
LKRAPVGAGRCRVGYRSHPEKGPGPCDPGPIGALRPRLTGAHA